MNWILGEGRCHHEKDLGEVSTLGEVSEVDLPITILKLTSIIMCN